MKIRSWLVAIALLTLAAAANATIFYVDGLTGDDSNPGTADNYSAYPKKTIQAAINAAQPGDEVRVCADFVFQYKECIKLKSGVALCGGYTIYSATHHDVARNWVNFTTIIDGNQADVVVRIPENADSTTRIDGFIIQNGRSWGIYIEGSGSTAKITHNNITRNGNVNSGGAIYIGNNSPKIADNLITSNKSSFIADNPSCGLINIGSLGSPVITNNDIVDNVGSAIYSTGTPSIYNNIIVNNSRGYYRPDNSQNSPTGSNNCVNSNTFDNSFPGTNIYDDPKITKRTSISIDPYENGIFLHQILRLQPGSPCINSGFNSSVETAETDINGRTRVYGNQVDIGADEYNGTCPSVPIIKVRPSGDDANDGLTWETAKKTIQAGIDACAAGSPSESYSNYYFGEVWVAAGTYVQPIHTHGNTELYGGFTGNETERNQRNWRMNETIIDGNNYDYAIQIYLDNPRIDGFTIRNGSAWGICIGPYVGSDSVTIVNNIITQNGNTTDGGAIYGCAQRAVISNNVITNNLASTDYKQPKSGLLEVYSDSYQTDLPTNITISNNTIVDNIGTAFYCPYKLYIYNNIIANNYRSEYFYNTSYGTPTTKNNCVFNNPLDNTLQGENNIFVDPKLAYTLKGIPHIQPDSPCVDAGYDDAIQPGWVDIDGQCRVYGNHMDIGADESDGTKWENVTPIIKVSTTGNDSNDGFTWETAKKTISAGIKATIPGGETWVVAGTYVENNNILKNIGLFGGFAGDETRKEQRNWRTNQTILDGNQAGSALNLGSSSTPKIKAEIDGFTIQNGTGTKKTSTSSITYGGGIYSSNCDAIIRNNRIFNNTATNGGGIYANSSSTTLTVENNYIANNSSTSGNTLYASSSNSTIKLVGNTICNNSNAGTSAAAILVGGLVMKDISVINNTIANNSGCGITLSIGPVNVTNNTIAFNDTGIYSSSARTIKNNCVFGNARNYAATITSVDNVEADPLFVDGANGDYHLSAGSPCINKGLNSAVSSLFDIDGQGRIAKGIVDIGADEYWSTAMCVSDAKNAPDTALISGTGATISAAFPDFFYIESDDRSSGIRVEKTGHQLTKGMKADISGTVSTTIDGERCIIADSAVENGSGSILPLGMNNRSLSSSIGLNSSGLLVRVWGYVTNSLCEYYYIDDGSHIKDGTGNIGIRVLGYAGSNRDHFVVVTGISSSMKTDDGKLIRVIRPLN